MMNPTPETMYQAAIAHTKSGSLNDGMQSILKAIELDRSNIDYHHRLPIERKAEA